MNKVLSKKKGKVSFSVSLVIPVYNNAKTAQKLLADCAAVLRESCQHYEILLCDDGSVDNSLEILTQFAKTHSFVSVLTHERNYGIARSLKDIYTKARCEYIILFSIDGGWNTKDIERLILSEDKTHSDIIIGQRKEKKYTLSRRFISFIYNTLPFLLFGVTTVDAGSIKIFKAEIFKKMKLQSKSVFFEAELLIKAKKQGYTMSVIPVSHKKQLYKTKSGVNKKEVFRAFFDTIKLRARFNV